MAKHLKDILQEAYGGSILEREVIDQVVTDLISLPLTEIIRDSGDDYYAMLNFVLEENRIDEENNEKVSYLDFAGLLLNLSDKVSGGSRYLTKNEEYYVVLNLFQQMFEKAAKVNSVVQTFLQLNVHCFYDYMEEKNHNGIIKNKKKKWEQYAQEEEVSIGQLLAKLKKESKESWLPWKSVGDYHDNIVKMYDGMSFLLVDTFASAYPERLHIEDLKEKLRGY